MADSSKLAVRSGDATMPTLAMCAGKDCRKRCEFAKVQAALTKQCTVVELKCIGLCNGPVVVADVEHSAPVVYSKLRSKRERKLLVELAAGDPVARKRLAGRKVAKKKVVSTVTRQLKRRVA